MMNMTHGGPVTVSWKGSTRYGVVVGDAAADALPTGASFIPVRFDDDNSTHNVDSRVVTLGWTYRVHDHA